MSGVWNKTLVYLGLVEEPEEPEVATVTDLPPAPERSPEPMFEERPSNVRELRRGDTSTTHVRRMGGGPIRVREVYISDFEDSAEIVDRYRTGQPVLFDLTEVDTDTGRRVLDFVSGVTYALRGRLTKAGKRVFLLVPEGVELPSDERDRLVDLGYRVNVG